MSFAWAGRSRSAALAYVGMGLAVSPESGNSPVVVVLAGGESTRMGTNKLALESSGRTLLGHIVDRIDRTMNLVIVGSRQSGLPGTWLDDEIPGGGPVVGIATAITHIRNQWPDANSVVVLAGDAPKGPLAIPALIAAASTAPSRCATVAGNPLCAVYAVEPLEAALDALMLEFPGGVGCPARRIPTSVHAVSIDDAWGAVDDIDTPRDAMAAGFHVPMGGCAHDGT